MFPGLMSALQGPSPSVSFEFFPPKDDAGHAALGRQVGWLGEVRPDFVSVTYGASGALDRRPERSIAATVELEAWTKAPVVAHVALTGHSEAELRDVIGQFLAADVAGFMALRGDPPGGPAGEWSQAPGGLTYAVELVRLIRSMTDLPIGVAAYPHGHPTAASLDMDTRVLAAKQAAGADFAVTQVLYSPSAYAALMERLGRAGVTIPVVPGVMPVTANADPARLELYSGAPLPLSLRTALERAAGDADAVGELGIDWTGALVADLLDLGAPGVHFYTLNRSRATAQICLNLGLTGTRGGQ